jgi:GNAT superfamily N-acetyltransferase
VLLAEADGTVVGMRVFMRWSWASGETTIPAVRAVDTATHPEWRGKGIFSRLTLALLEQMREEGVAFVFNTPNDQSRPGYLKMGWSSLGRLTPWIRPSRPVRLLRAAIAPRAKGRIAPPGLETLPNGGLPTVDELLAQPELEGFLRRVRAGDVRLATPLSPAYLRWRYSDIPGFEYRAAWSLEPEHGAALILRVKQQGPLSELRLCEVLVAPTARSRRMARALLKDVVSRSRCDYASALSARGTPEQTTLVTSGFLPAARLGPVFTVRPLNDPPGGTDPSSLAGWRVSTGDLELF